MPPGRTAKTSPAGSAAQPLEAAQPPGPPQAQELWLASRPELGRKHPEVVLAEGPVRIHSDTKHIEVDCHVAGYTHLGPKDRIAILRKPTLKETKIIHALRNPDPKDVSKARAVEQANIDAQYLPVSYTHLTLPTILRV